MNTPQIDDLLIWMGGVAAAILAVVAVMVLAKNWLLSDLRKSVEDMKSQLYRNGGTSLRDAIDRIEERQGLIAAEVRRVTERLDDHINFHLEDK